MKSSPNKLSANDSKLLVSKTNTLNEGKTTVIYNAILSKYEEKVAETPKHKSPSFPNPLSHSLKVGGQGAMNKEQLEKIAASFIINFYLEI